MLLSVSQGEVTVVNCVLVFVSVTMLATDSPQAVAAAVAQAQTELAPAMTDGMAAGSQAVATQGTRSCERLCCAAC